MKAIEQYFHVVLFIMLYKVVLIFQSVNETLMCDHPNVSAAVFSLCSVYCAVQGVAIFYFKVDSQWVNHSPSLIAVQGAPSSCSSLISFNATKLSVSL